jgi:hypothetical protein
LQLLEGDKAVVKVAFERIKQDRRHVEVEVLLEFEDQARIFPKWAMGYLPAETAGTQAIQEAMGILEKVTALGRGGERLQVVKALR